ncbi:MAG: hypothetical protein ACI4SH_06085 [Candidatus Scatosoma sp.]
MKNFTQKKYSSPTAVIKLLQGNFIATSGENEVQTTWLSDWGVYDGAGV